MFKVWVWLRKSIKSASTSLQQILISLVRIIKQLLHRIISSILRILTATMPSQSILCLAMMATAALASPMTFKIVPRDTDCPATNGPEGGDQKNVATIDFFPDKDCIEASIHRTCLYTQVFDGDEGVYSCSEADLPEGVATPFYGKLVDSPKPNVQLLYTRDQSCPPNGAGAVFVSMVNKPTCVEFNQGGETPGLAVYPNGGSGIARFMEKRDGPKCKGFTVESESLSYSPTVQVSNIIDCINGGDSGCPISVEQSHTESVTTSFSATAGGGIEGIFSVSATFGTEYTEEDTTTIQEGVTVPKGVKAYLSAYSSATLFTGKFTECDSGDAEQAGQVLAIKKGTFTYALVNTNSRLADGITA
jgi:hypothetical protein